MKATRSILAVAALLVPAAGFALPGFVKVFDGTYPIPANSALKKAGCAACHTGASGGALNAYGKDQQKAIKTMKASSLTPVVLRSVENLDSDKDGVKNITEIKAGTLPGDPKSKPGKPAGKKPAKPAKKK